MLARCFSNGWRNESASLAWLGEMDMTARANETSLTNGIRINIKITPQLIEYQRI